MPRLKKIPKLVMGKLEKYGIPIFSHYEAVSDEYVILADKLILIYTYEFKDLRVSFHVSSQPNYVASIMLILKEIKELTDVLVMESFIYRNDELVSGEEAHELYSDLLSESIIEEYIKEQNTLFLLANSEVMGTA